MNKKKSLIGFSFFLFYSFNSFAQLNSNVGHSEITKINERQSATEKKEINKEVEKKSELVLTPEQQGFTKITLPSGDIVYRKQENNMIIEYRPNN